MQQCMGSFEGAVRCQLFCVLEVKWGEADLIALQRWSHEDHWPHRGHHVVGRDVFLPEIGEGDRRTEGTGVRNAEACKTKVM